MIKKFMIKIVATMITFMLIVTAGCNIQLAGEKVTKEEFIAAMTATDEKLLIGTYKMNIKGTATDADTTQEIDILFAKEANTRLQFKGSFGSTAEDLYMELKNNTTYQITKVDDKWKGNNLLGNMLSSFDFGAYTGIPANINAVIAYTNYDSLNFKNGKFYYSTDMLKDLSNANTFSATTYTEFFIIVKEGLLGGMGMKFLRISGIQETTYEYTVKLSYIVSIDIPAYEVDSPV